MATQTANQGGWSLSNRVRFREGFLEKVGGWEKFVSHTAAGTVRALYAYQDLADNKNLMIGGDGGLQAYVVPGNGSTSSLINIVLARRTDTTLYASTALDTFSGTNTSSAINVHDPAHGAVVGNTVALPLPISIGQRTISPQTVTVASVVDANNWTFTNSQALLADANTGGSYGTTPIFSVTAAEINTATCRVTFPYHGLIVGSTYTVQYAVVWQSYGTLLSVPAGMYTVASVVDTSTFTITTTGLTQTALSFGAEVGFDPAQAAGTIYGVIGLVYYLSGSLAAPSGDWFLDNFGGQIIIGLGDGPIYRFIPPVSQAGSPATAQLISTAPLVNAGTLVAMPQAQVIAYGSETTIGSGVQDPLMVRWCDAGDYTTWTASSTNQAGSFRLSRGSRIISGLQAPQTTLLWTDIDLWSMSYIQPPLVYSFTIIGSGCGIISAKARATLGRSTYWMGQKQFFMFGDQGVQTVECPIWDTIFNNLPDQPVHSHIFAGANEAFGEVWWFYPSTDSDDGECDSYVKWRVADGPAGWDYGTLDRTSWIGTSVFGMPLASSGTDYIQQHESGYDDDTVAMDGVYAESGFFDVGNGDGIPFVDQFIPDIKWFGSGGSLNLTIWGVNYPSDTPEMYGPYTVTPSSQIVPARVRQRQVALRVDWANTAGFSARLGAIRARIAPAGRRP